MKFIHTLRSSVAVRSNTERVLSESLVILGPFFVQIHNTSTKLHLVIPVPDLEGPDIWRVENLELTLRLHCGYDSVLVGTVKHSRDYEPIDAETIQWLSPPIWSCLLEHDSVVVYHAFFVDEHREAR